MAVITMHQAKSTLSQLVERVAHGETIFIGAYGIVKAKLVSANSIEPQKRLGILAGKITIPDDFDAPLPEDILNSFYGMQG